MTTKDLQFAATGGLSHKAARPFRRSALGAVVIMAGPLGEQEDMT
jgi:hypothetical protein